MQETIDVPDEYLCPISTQIMKNPVIAGDGITYQQKFIKQWLTKSNISPFTGKKLPHKSIITNYALKNAIQTFNNKLPAIQKQNQIKIDLQYAIKVKQQEVDAFVDKAQRSAAYQIQIQKGKTSSLELQCQKQRDLRKGIEWELNLSLSQNKHLISMNRRLMGQLAFVKRQLQSIVKKGQQMKMSIKNSKQSINLKQVSCQSSQHQQVIKNNGFNVRQDFQSNKEKIINTTQEENDKVCQHKQELSKQSQRKEITLDQLQKVQKNYEFILQQLKKLVNQIPIISNEKKQQNIDELFTNRSDQRSIKIPQLFENQEKDQFQQQSPLFDKKRRKIKEYQFESKAGSQRKINRTKQYEEEQKIQTKKYQ